MAEFEVRQLGETRYIAIELDDEMVRVEVGPSSAFDDQTDTQASLVPSIGDFVGAVLGDEAIHPPTCVGDGAVTLESSLGGFYVLELNGGSSVLEGSQDWQLESYVDVRYQAEPAITNLMAGEEPLLLQTKIRGEGRIVLTTKGPMEAMRVNEARKLSAEGKYVLTRSGAVSFRIVRLKQDFFGRDIPDERQVYIYEGTGTLLISPALYLRYRRSGELVSAPVAPAAT